MANTKVTGDVIANGTISTVHIADDAITAAKLDSTATGITFADLAVDTDTLYVDSANNRVGIGTSSPSYKLGLSNSNTLTAVYQQFTNGTTGTTSSDGTVMGIDADGDFLINNQEAKEIKLYTSDTQRLTIQSGGNVGIGTTNPSTILDVRNSINIGGSGQDSNIYFQQNTSNQARINYYTDNSMYFDNWNGGYYFRTTSSFTPRVTILNGGNVGIGTTSPDLTGFGYTTLTVVGGTIAGYAGVLELGSPSTNANGQNLGIIAFMDGNTRNAQINATRASSNSTSNIHFYTNGGSGIEERMRIDANGAVGIGRNTASYRLSLLSESSGTVQNGVYISAGTGNSNHAFYVENQNGSAEHLAVRGDGQIRLNASSVGRILAGTTVDNTYDRLQVIGNAWIGGNSARGIRIADGGTYASMVGINQAVTAYTGLELRASGTNGQLFLSTNGYVGIGKTSPISPLHIKAASGGIFRIEDSSGNIGAYTEFSGGYAYQYYYQLGGGVKIALSTNGNSYFTGGNVGIGVTNPSFKTHFRGGSNTEETVLKLDKSSYSDTGGHTTILGFGNEPGGWAKGGIGYERTGSYDKGKIHFLQANTSNTNTVTLADSVMTIQPDGKVGIGVSNPQFEKLEVAGNIKANDVNGKFYTNAYTVTTASSVDTFSHSGAGLWEYTIRINPNPGGSGSYEDFYYGKVGIGTGWNGSNVTDYIWYQEDQTAPRSLYPSGGGDKTISFVMVSGGSEVTNVVHGTTITVRIKGFGGHASYNQGIEVYFRRLA